jgi:hypothetical protein
MSNQILRVVAWAPAISVILSVPCAGQKSQVLFIDARKTENQACVVEREKLPRDGCPNGPDGRYLDRTNGVELAVVNRPFLTEYSVRVDGVSQVQPPRIRGLQEVTSIVPGAPALIAPPPSKGEGRGLAVIQSRTTVEFLGQLIDEAQLEKPAMNIEADANELKRQLAALSDQLDDLMLKGASLVTRPRGGDCRVSRRAPNTGDAITCLENALKNEQDATKVKDASNKEWFTDEDQFRRLLSQARDLLEMMSALQGALTAADLPRAASLAEEDVARVEKNVLAFESSLTALRNALAIREQLLGSNGAYGSLRRAQLRAAIRRDLKLTAGDAAVALDEGELNALVADYVAALARGGQERGKIYSELKDKLGGWNTFATAAKIQAASLRQQWAVTSVELGRLPALVDKLNDAQSSMVTYLNYIYDNSSVAGPSFRQINLGTHTGNLRVYYSILRTDNFARFRVVSPASFAQASAAGAAPQASTPPANDGSPAPNAGTVVASGVVEVHEFDQAAVVAGFAFSRLADNEYVTRPNPATEGTFTIVNTSSRKQQHVMVGLNVYLQGRDTYPGAQRDLLSTLGIFGGISANSFRDYFVGFTVEPRLGVNATVGWHWGKETVLESPLTNASIVSVETVPTARASKRAMFVSAGLDLAVFVKLFGKIVGLGTVEPASTQRALSIGFRAPN